MRTAGDGRRDVEDAKFCLSIQGDKDQMSRGMIGFFREFFYTRRNLPEVPRH